MTFRSKTVNIYKMMGILHLCPKVVDTFLNIFHHRDTETQSFYNFSPCLRVSVVMLSFFLFFIHFPLISQAEPPLLPQSESNIRASDSNSLKTSSSPSQSEASSLFVKAIVAMEKKDLKTARHNFERLIFHHPQNQKTSISCFYLGEIYQKEGLEQEAQAIYGQFIQQYPDHQLLPEVLFRQAEIHFQLVEIKRAQKIFKQLLFQYPKTNLAHNASFRLGDCLYQSDDPSTARLYYDEGMKKRPEYINNHPQTA